MKKTTKSPQVIAQQVYALRYFEAEVIPGLEEIAAHEIRKSLGKQAQDVRVHSAAIIFAYSGRLNDLNFLSTVIAVYEVMDFAVPRPKALLGHQHLSRILAQIELTLGSYSRGDFESFYIGAAGSSSSVMQRIKVEIAEQTGLIASENAGDLLLRIRPGSSGGWQVLIRLTPRPLATRKWRAHNIPGALNASVAHAMALLTQVSSNDRFLNIGCGSGTILVERALSGPCAQLLGVDFEAGMLSSCRTNLESAGISQQRYSLIQADASELPFEDSSLDVISADLPFGQLVGSHKTNVRLYPALMKEAARVAKPGCRAIFLTHEIRLFENLLREMADEWELRDVNKIVLTGLHPRMYSLVRR